MTAAATSVSNAAAASQTPRTAEKGGAGRSAANDNLRALAFQQADEHAATGRWRRGGGGRGFLRWRKRRGGGRKEVVNAAKVNVAMVAASAQNAV